MVAPAGQSGIATAQQTPKVRTTATFTIDAPAGPLDVYQSAIRIAPGKFGITHTHPGHEAGVIVDGTMALYKDAKITPLKAGDTFSYPAGTIHAAGNQSAADTFFITSHLLPRGSVMATPMPVEGAPPGLPTSTERAFLSKFEVDKPPSGPLTVVQQVVDLPAGGSVPMHTHEGIVLVTVMDGELTVTDPSGAATVYKKGDKWMENIGDARAIKNASASSATAFIEMLLAKGASDKMKLL